MTNPSSPVTPNTTAPSVAECIEWLQLIGSTYFESIDTSNPKFHQYREAILAHLRPLSADSGERVSEARLRECEFLFGHCGPENTLASVTPFQRAGYDLLNEVKRLRSAAPVMASPACEKCGGSGKSGYAPTGFQAWDNCPSCTHTPVAVEAYSLTSDEARAIDSAYLSSVTPVESAEQAETRRNAERYLWLRNAARAAPLGTPTVIIGMPGQMIEGAKLDAAIDAALSTTAEAKAGGTPSDSQ